MSIGFPPEPVYPLAFDSDTTLYKVYNTSETRTRSNNAAAADEMEIVPVDADKPEIWADNGFATIEGELFYYDAVEKDSNDRVNKLKRLARNLGGKKSKFNDSGTWVRGFVIADHHNQLADIICIIERFIGTQCTAAELASCPLPGQRETLDCRIRRLFDEPPCTDDFSCPSVDFSLTTASVDPCIGTTVQYDVAITGSFTAYRLDFGDGTFTTQEQTGTHVYAPNATIDPIVNVSNPNCQIVQTPITRENPNEPQQFLTPEPFEVPIPGTPDFPTITIPNFDIPTTTLELPQILFPCLEAGSVSLPSVITISPPLPSVLSIIPPIVIPSVITLTPVVPSIITIFPAVPEVIFFGPNPLPFTIGFGPAPTIQVSPGTISIDASGVPPSINFGPAPSFSPVEFAPCPSCSPIEFGDPPTISVDWGTPPTCSCTVTVVCPSPSPLRAQSMFVDDDFLDGFSDSIELESTGGIGIPSEIKLIAPKIPDVKLVHDLPTKIYLDVPVIPDIRVNADAVPREITLVTKIDSIKLDTSALPASIKLDASDMPRFVKLDVPLEFPKILVDASSIPTSIQVNGIPTQIEVVHNIPEKIIAEFSIPEELKNWEVPLVYKGGPIPIKFTEANIVDDNGEACFRLVPCDPK